MISKVQPRARVLLVDDDPAICRDYGRVLRRLKLDVETATNGWEALERIIPDRFDAVLVDIAMPGLDGLGVLRGIRDRDPELPVVLMTGSPALATAVKAVEYGASQYLFKPIHPDRLAEAMWRAVDLRETLRQRHGGSLLAQTDRARAKDETVDRVLDTVLSAFWLEFQPIIQATSQRVFGYEAFVRSSSALASPAELFDAAERTGRAHEVGRVIRRKVAETASSVPGSALLFVKLHAEELSDNELLSSSAPLSTVADQVVLEITERSALREVAGVWTRLGRLRKLGFRIALDDLGEGHAGLTSVLQLHPDFVKLDSSLVRNIDRSPRKRSLVRAVTRVCSRDLGIQVVCEGVERHAERDALVEDGLDLFQGHLFAKPAAGFPTPTW
jgi:EAL domain-containing protein (putative c-di-GMP-specific phosphodiesterase class I)